MANLPTYNGTQGAFQAPPYTMSNLLAANTPEFITVPKDENGQYARIVTFSKTGDFYAKAFTAADAADRVEGGNFTNYVAVSDFASDTVWVKGTGWTISGGVANATGAISTAISQTITALVPGQTYQVTYTATQSAGSVTVSLGGTNGTARSTSATFTETIVCGTSGVLAFTGAGFTGTLDNVIVTPWTYGTGWADGSGVATATTSSATLTQTNTATGQLKNGQAYYVTFTATRSAGSVTVSLGGTSGTARSSAATFSEVIIAGSAQDITFTGNGFSGTIDTVSVIPCAVVPGDVTTGNSNELNPSGYFLNGNITTISICAASTPIITHNFYK